MAAYTPNETLELKIEQVYGISEKTNRGVINPVIPTSCPDVHATIEMNDARVSKAPSSANGPRTPPTTSARGHDRRVIERTGRNKAIGRPTKSQPTNETIANSKKVTQAALPIANLLS